MNICTKLAFAIGLALSLTAIETSPVFAATLSYNFFVDVTSGSLANSSLVGNKYKGYFSYDDSALEDGEAESVKGLSLSFDFFGHYTEENDHSYPDYPVAYFNERELLGLDYLSYTNADSVLRLYLDTFYFETGADSVAGNVTYSLASVNPAPVPEPDATLELGLLSSIGWLLKKRIILSR